MAAAIDILTEDDLLQIFDFHLDSGDSSCWHALVHVCRRWRNIIFSSSDYLMLRLLCMPTTPVRESLHTWPPLSIIIDCDHHPTSGWDNVIAALEQNDRVYEVSLLDLSFLTLGDVREKMDHPYPELTYLELHADDVVLPELFDSFLGGYAPRLAAIRLFGVRYRTYFGRPRTSKRFSFASPIPGTSHRTRCSFAFPL